MIQELQFWVQFENKQFVAFWFLGWFMEERTEFPGIWMVKLLPCPWWILSLVRFTGWHTPCDWHPTLLYDWQDSLLGIIRHNILLYWLVYSKSPKFVQHPHSHCLLCLFVCISDMPVMSLYVFWSVSQTRGHGRIACNIISPELLSQVKTYSFTCYWHGGTSGFHCTHCILIFE